MMFLALRFLPHIAALSAVLGAAVYVWHLRTTNDRLEAQNAALTLRIEGCAARSENILEDMETDREVDTIPDDGLRDVPSHWLRQ